MIDQAKLLESLSSVRDPELDRPITELGFVEGLDTDGSSVRVRLRLPTYFCAPNFAYIMAADAKAAAAKVEGVEEVQVSLVDHFVSDEINDGLANGRDFEGTFPGQATGGLDDLRDLFRRKAFIARQERLCRTLQEEGIEQRDLPRLRIGDLPPLPQTRLYLERRAELGIDTSDSAPFLVTPDGKRIPEEAMGQHLRFARTVRVSIDANAGLCTSLLETRYGIKLKVGG